MTTTAVAIAVTDIALLGCGTVGAALARRVAAPHIGSQLRIVQTLVRDARARRSIPQPHTLTTDPRAVFAGQPSVVVELLGGVEPARSLVLEALARGIPVVTANKTLLARHGAELRAAARETATPLLYEAAVLAGVPFLGTFMRRPHAAAATGLQAIANGTSNYVLTRCADAHCAPVDALLDAQRLGYAERDPRSDITGLDACEKLAVLLELFAGADVAPGEIETEGIQPVTPALMLGAGALGGVIKPVAVAEWSRRLEAFVGPVFVPSAHPLASVHGVENALLLDTDRGRLRFQGPGAGPDVTAATVLDDVHEIAAGLAPAAGRGVARPVRPHAPFTGWLVSFSGAALPQPADLADYLAAHGVHVRTAGGQRASGGRVHQAFLTWPVAREPLEQALAAARRAARCESTHIRALERATPSLTDFRQE